MRTLGVAASVALLYASHLVPGLSALAFVALVPFLLAARGLGVAGATALGLMLGTGFGVAAGGWIPGAFAHFGSIGVTPWLGQLLAAIAFLGVPYAAFGAISAALQSSPPGVRILAIGLGFFALDGARSHGLLGWPWLLLGHSQAHAHGLAQLAVLGGVPLISGLVAAVNAAAAESAVLARERSRISANPLAVPIVAAVAISFGLGLPLAQWFQPSGAALDSLDVLLVQPNIPVEERWVSQVQRTHLAIAARLTEQAVERASTIPDFIVWPETYVTTPIDRDEPLRAALLQLAARFPAPLVVGAVRSSVSGDASRYRGSALWLDPTQGIQAAVDKTQGVPIVESDGDFPGARLVRALAGQPETKLLLEEAPRAGPLRSGDVSFAVLFCFEVIYPGLTAERRDAQTRAILNLANDSWIADPAISRQQLAFASFRAIEQRLPLLRVAHGGISAAIDPFGRIAQEIPFDTEGTAVITLGRGRPPGGAERAAFAALLAAGAIMGAGLDRALRR